MCSLKLPYENRRAFTLIELILFMAISSLLMLTYFSVLTFNLRVSERNLLEDEMLLNGRYILEYIKEEIAHADRIVTSSNFAGLDEKFPTNIGFVIVNVQPHNPTTEKITSLDSICNYSTYYFNDNKIIRIAASKIGNNQLPYHGLFRGYNEIAGGVLESSKISLEQNDLVKFDLCLGEDKREIVSFKSTINLRCPVVRSYE